MEVASMMPYRLPDNYHTGYQQPYVQYHDMRTQHPTSAYANVRSGNNTPQSPSAAGISAEDGHKPSLPSISNLLGIADGERGSQTAHESQSPSQLQAQQVAHQQAQHFAAQTIGTSSYTIPVDSNGIQRAILPPSPPPPMRSDSVVEPVPSPSTISSRSSASGPSYYAGSSLNNLEPHQQRVNAAPVVKRHSLPMQNAQAMYNTSPYGMGPYMTSPSGLSTSSYYSADGVYPSNAMYQQRPLPTNFPPQMIPAPPMMAPGAVPAANPWEHHHYISASSQASFPSIQERYICGTCKKAFSRPSSLKIHSHSHTGEKPFKCAHAGCGKSFSVRSNMKRHERGCHAESELVASA